MHDEDEIERLYRHFTYWDYPIEHIRNYFGEQVGFYFAFSTHYLNWLGGLSIIASATQLYMVISKDTGGVVISIFSIVVIIWASLMLNFWVLRESKSALDWGMLDFESKEKIRPAFQSQGDDVAEKEDALAAKDPFYTRGKRWWYSSTL